MGAGLEVVDAEDVGTVVADDEDDVTGIMISFGWSNFNSPFNFL